MSNPSSGSIQALPQVGRGESGDARPRPERMRPSIRMFHVKQRPRAFALVKARGRGLLICGHEPQSRTRRIWPWSAGTGFGADVEGRHTLAKESRAHDCAGDAGVVGRTAPFAWNSVAVRRASGRSMERGSRRRAQDTRPAEPKPQQAALHPRECSSNRRRAAPRRGQSSAGSRPAAGGRRAR